MKPLYTYIQNFFPLLLFIGLLATPPLFFAEPYKKNMIQLHAASSIAPGNLMPDGTWCPPEHWMFNQSDQRVHIPGTTYIWQEGKLYEDYYNQIIGTQMTTFTLPYDKKIVNYYGEKVTHFIWRRSEPVLFKELNFYISEDCDEHPSHFLTKKFFFIFGMP